MSKTAIRRHHEARIRAARKCLHLAVEDVYLHEGCWCTKNPGQFYSRHPFSCGCRRRRRGRPRIVGGMCRLGSRDRIYKWRRQERLLSWYSFDSDDFEKYVSIQRFKRS